MAFYGMTATEFESLTFADLAVYEEWMGKHRG